MRAERLLACAAALLAAGGPAHASDMGTLFHTAEERARLDRLRRGEPTEFAAAARSRPRELTGFVSRSDGRNTVWIDGRPVVVSSPRAAPLLDPRAVGEGDPGEGSVKIERRAPVKP